MISFSLSSQTCGLIYVTPTGNGTGTKVNPTSLENGLNSANPNDVLRIAIGNYTIDNSLNLLNDLTLEGGFDPTNGWSKTSLASATTINRTTLNPEGPANAPRLVAFYGNNISNFRLQDLTITIDDAVLNGTSTYAVHLNNCSDYTIARCQLLPGNAGDGIDGTDGNNGVAGVNGFSGQNGDNDNQSAGGGGGIGGDGGGASNAGSGGAGGSTAANNGLNGGAPSGIFGGGGGGGASGGGEDRDGGEGGNGGGSLGAGGTGGLEDGCASGVTCNSSKSGNDGANGDDGNNGSLGSNGPSGSHVSGFWVPGTIAGTGANGTGGAGGGGGGGGAGQGGGFCIDGKGSGGGGGGGGGQAGTGGTGGTGGGSSYGLYLINNGANGTVLQSLASAGNPGAGGQGGTGGQGGNGDLGGAGATYTGNEVGCGGNGGNGGKGGDGGDGGNGQPGEAINIYLNSGDPLTTSNNTFNLAAQPEIIKDSVTCVGSPVEYSTSGTPDWDFDVNSNAATPGTATTSPASSTYNSNGRFTVSNDGSTYEGFTFITPEQTVNAGVDQQLCDVTTGTLVGTTSGTNVTWISLGTATVNDPTNITTNVQNLQPGENKFVLTAGDCCPGDPDTIALVVGTANTGSDIQAACDSYTWIDGNTYTSNNSTATHVLTNVTGCDSVVTLDLTINQSSTGVDDIYACNEYTWIDGNTYTSSNNTATYTLTNTVGCDSIVSLDLTINNPDVSVTNNSPMLTANASQGTFQWVSCDENYSPIAGETDATYTAVNNGSYAVIVTQNGCTDTSACEMVANVGLEDLNKESLMIFPNPTNGIISISHSSVIRSIQIFDATGRKMIDETPEKEKTMIDLGNFSKGAYTIEIGTNNDIIRRKVMKQ